MKSALRARSRRPAAAVLLSALALFALLSAPAALAWGGAQHVYINRFAAKNVPEEMAAFRQFALPMCFPAIYPDLWKSYDADENARHYFEPDRLPKNFDFSTLSPDPAKALKTVGLTREELGIAPWTIADLTAQMSDAMRTNDWLRAARVGATLGHYVGDIHMPLHCTRNFNGWETRQTGVHGRFESEMVKAFFNASELFVPNPAYIEDPFAAAVEWCLHSHSLCELVLQADLEATRAAGGRTDTEEYYSEFWVRTGELAMDQIGWAASHLASLWYTAWVDAGRPEIPPPFEEIPVYSIFSGVGIDAPETDGTPLPDPNKKRFDLIIRSVLGALILLALLSAIFRPRASRTRRP